MAYPQTSFSFLGNSVESILASGGVLLILIGLLTNRAREFMAEIGVGVSGDSFILIGFVLVGLAIFVTLARE